MSDETPKIPSSSHLFKHMKGVRVNIKQTPEPNTNPPAPEKHVIIGFAGKAEAGKDTAAHFVSTKRKAYTIAFANPLKMACKSLYGFTDYQLHDSIAKETVDERWGVSPREVLQWLGTDVLREKYGGQFLIRRAKMDMDTIMNNSIDDCVIVFPDVRFDDEARFIQEMGGKIVRIVRPNAPTTAHSNHVSEAGLTVPVDATVVNDGDLDTFYDRLETVLVDFF